MTAPAAPAPGAAPPPPRARWLVDAAVLLTLSGIALWLRWPALFTEGFHNEDAAGIAYNADLLRRGLLPMVDSLELKAPGSFFVSWLSWGAFGRSVATLQRVACAWALLAGAGVYVGGVLLYGRRAGVVAALIYTVFAPITDSIDINYGAWMAMPYVWATVALIAGLRGGRAGYFAVAGLALAWAGLLKRQAAVLFPLFLVVLLYRRWVRPDGWADAPPRRRATGLLFLGLAAGFGTLMAYYLAHGALGTFVHDYFFSEGGWRYAAQGRLGWGEKLPRVGDGFLGFWEYMATPSLLAAMTLVGAYRPGRPWTLRGALLGGHFWLSFLGAALGFRFFKGYYLQVLPAAAWIAAHPDGALTRWLRAEAWTGPARRRAGAAAVALCTALALVPALINDVGQLKAIRARREHPLDREAQRAARVIVPNTGPEDTIWVWGRWAWPVYFHADRLAATRYYKVLGVVTNNLTNTWRRPTEPTRFVAGGPDADLIADLKKNRPAFIVVSHNELYRDWTAFKALLASDYQPVPNLRMRQFTVYNRRDHVLVKPVRPNPPRRAKPKHKPRPKPKPPPPASQPS